MGFCLQLPPPPSPHTLLKKVRGRGGGVVAFSVVSLTKNEQEMVLYSDMLDGKDKRNG